MRKFILSFAILAFALGAKAQDTKVSVGASLGLPTTSGLSFAYGGDIQADFGIAEGTAVTASAGYLNYTWKGGYGTFGYIPLLGGVKYSFGESGMYGHAQIGYGFASKGGGGAFAYAPGLGYNISDNLDLGLKYLAFSKNGTLGSVNLRVAYRF